MRRRELLPLLGAAAIVGPRRGWAKQRRRLPRLAFLTHKGPDQVAQRGQFENALQRLGWTDGGNLRIDYRAIDLDREDIATVVKDRLVADPDIVLTKTTPITGAVLRQTRTIPVVFTYVSDPVGAGFVKSLARPGGDVTGFIDEEAELGGKWLQLLKEMVPSLTRAALMFNPETSPEHGDYFLAPFLAAGKALGVAAAPAPVHDLHEIEAAMTALAHPAGGGLAISAESFMDLHVSDIIGLADRLRLPVIYPVRGFAELGGLISYGFGGDELMVDAAGYVDRILKGAKPGELPVQAPTKFELIVNDQTAKALGITVPPGLLAEAADVIE
jgi:putative ABC transport system substrate-binding protein